MADPYANPWRPLYEAWALVLWLAVALVAWATADWWRCMALPSAGSPPWRWDLP